MSTDPDRLEHHLERRSAQRFEVHLPLAVHFDGRTVPGFTQDLTGRGIFLLRGDGAPGRGGRGINFYHALRNHFGGQHASSVSWAGVARLFFQADHSHVGQRNGIAVQLDSYEYLASNEPHAQFVRVSSPGAAGATSGPHPR